MPAITMRVPMKMMEVTGYPDNGSYALSFDGVDDYTSLDWSDQLSTYTVSMWVISNAVQQTNYDAFFSTHHLIALDFN